MKIGNFYELELETVEHLLKRQGFELSTSELDVRCKHVMHIEDKTERKNKLMII